MDQLARTPDQIGHIIRRTRKQRDLTQAALGERAGLRQATVSLIENGNPAVKLNTILAVLTALDLEFRITGRSKSDASDLEGIF